MAIRGITKDTKAIKGNTKATKDVPMDIKAMSGVNLDGLGSLGDTLGVLSYSPDAHGDTLNGLGNTPLWPW